MLLLIDNYDSFTYNLVQYLAELGADVLVKRNDALSIDDIAHLAPTHIVLSPGPCTPNESGICLDLIERYSADIPILGVCLGHQAIGQHFGGVITQAGEIMHGKTSMISHSGSKIFTGLPSPLRVGRYHSLVIAPDSLPDCLMMTAWTDATPGKKLEIMGISHKTYPLHGVQFHPESILSEFGLSLLKNFLENP